MARIMVISAVAAVCIAVLLSAFFSRNKKSVDKMAVLERTKMAGQETEPPNPFAGRAAKTAGNPRPSRGGWANSLLPFYSLGILAYIVFVVGKIMTRQYSGRRRESLAGPSWMSKRPNKGSAKTKITMHEIRQLEERLMETEEAVQQILANASKTLELASNKMDSQENSEEEMYGLGNGTMSSSKRNPEGKYALEEIQFQEDSSSEGERRHPLAPQFRKRVLAKKQMPATRKIKGQSSSSDEERIVSLRRRKKNSSSKESEDINGRQHQTKERSHQTSTDASNDDDRSGLTRNRLSMELRADSSTMSSKDDGSLSDDVNLLATAGNIQETRAEIQSYIAREKMQSMVDS